MRLRWEFIALVLLLIASWVTAAEPQGFPENPKKTNLYPPAKQSPCLFKCQINTFAKNLKQIAKGNLKSPENKIGEIRENIQFASLRDTLRES